MQPTDPPRDGAASQSGDGPRSLSVLLVEDNPGDARLFEEYLDEYATQTGVEATLRREESLEAGLEALAAERPHVVVLDLGLPDNRSVDTVQRAAAAAPPTVPIVVLTGQDDLEVALSAQQAGAAEYIRKEELSPSLLGRTLRWAAERSQMEARLRQRDAWIRSITESVSGGVFRVGPTGRIEYANDALAGLLGFEGPEQLLGKDLTTFYAEASARGTLLAREGAETEEVELKRRDGSTFTGLLSAEAARREGGTLIHFDGCITDITERKRAERRLQESHERLATAQRIAGLGSWERRFDEDGRLYWSEETRRIFGWDPGEEVTYETFMEAVRPEDREALRAQQEQALEEGLPVDIEYRIRRSNGEVRVLKEQGEAAFAEGGSPIRLSGTVLDITERKKREKRLKVLSEAAEQAKEVVLITEAEPLGKPGPEIVYVNEAFEAMTGYSEAEVLGKTPRILQGPETERAVLDSFREALETGEEWEGETVNYRKDGESYRVQWNVSPVRGEEGDIQYWISVQRDVTEEREREETLRRQKHLLEQAQKVAGAWEVDLQVGEQTWSEEVYRILEIDPGTEVSMGEGMEYYAPEARPKIREAFERCVEEGKPYDLELPLDTAKGNRRWVRTVGAPSKTEDGEVVKVAGAFQDITDRKEAERELRRSRELYRSLFRGSSEAILVHDLEGRVQEANPRAEVLFGYDSEELKGAVLAELHAEEDEETPRRKVDTLRAGDPFEATARYRREDGSTFWGEVSATVTEVGGEAVVRSLIRDITERKEAEQELRRSREQLSMAVEGGNIGTWNWDVETGEVIFNRQWAEMLGYSREELDFQFSTWEELVHPEDLSRAADVLERYVEGETDTYNPEIRMRTKSGERKWIQTIGKVVERSEDGNAKRIAGIHLDIDERKRAEDALQEREAQLRGLANSIPGVVFQSYARPEKDYGFHFVSQHAEDVLGISRDPSDFFERCMRRVPDAERETLMNTIEKAVDEAGPLSFEAPFVKPSGEQIWLLGTATPEPREDELIYNGVILDITERERATRELEKREEQLRTITDNVAEGIYRSVPEEGIVYANSAFVEMFGYDSIEEVREVDPSSLYADPDERERHMEALVDIDSFEGHEEEFRRKDGTTFTGRLTGTVIRAEDGTVKHFDGAIADITEQKKRERTLRLFEKMVDQAKDAILVTEAEPLDEPGPRIEYVNPSFEEMTGYAEEDLLGDTPRILQGPETERGVLDSLREALEAGESWEGETVNYRKEGEPYIVRWSIAPVVGEDGTVESWMSVQRDLTDRREREQQLREAKEEAEEANRLKSVFLANMSHEIRTPLTSILGFAEAIGEGGGFGEEETVVEFARLIEQSGQRLMNTLTAVLNLSRLQAGEMNLDLGPVDLTAEAAETIEEFGPQAKKAGIELKASPDSRSRDSRTSFGSKANVDPEARGNCESVWARADEGGVQIALRNLLSNAIKYTKEGGEVRVRTRVEGERAAVEVEDTGIGMDPETVSGLFEAFKQASEGIGRKYEGTGLGLTVTKGVLSRMGGSIDVETEKGVGSRFTAWLPRAEDGPSS